MARKKEKKYPKTREERVTRKPPVEETLDKNSREYHALHGWPKGG